MSFNLETLDQSLFLSKMDGLIIARKIQLEKDLEKFKYQFDLSFNLNEHQNDTI